MSHSVDAVLDKSQNRLEVDIKLSLLECLIVLLEYDVLYFIVFSRQNKSLLHHL